MEKQGKLELTWVGKYEEERLEPRILIEDPEKSNGEDSENMPWQNWERMKMYE